MPQYVVNLMFIQRSLQKASTAAIVITRRHRSSPAALFQSDDACIPLQPTWSVNHLLSSYQTPKIKPHTLNRLYQLSALTPPPEGSLEHDQMTKEMEQLVKLVEAVKLVDTSAVYLAETIATREEGSSSPSDGSTDDDCEHGTALLAHAARTSGAFYVMDADRRR